MEGVSRVRRKLGAHWQVVVNSARSGSCLMTRAPHHHSAHQLVILWRLCIYEFLSVFRTFAEWTFFSWSIRLITKKNFFFMAKSAKNKARVFIVGSRKSVLCTFAARIVDFDLLFYGKITRNYTPIVELPLTHSALLLRKEQFFFYNFSTKVFFS